jgi:hypothetical protein
MQHQKQWIDGKHLQVLNGARDGAKEHTDYLNKRHLLHINKLDLFLTDIRMAAVCFNIPVWPDAFQRVVHHKQEALHQQGKQLFSKTPPCLWNLTIVAEIEQRSLDCSATRKQDRKSLLDQYCETLLQLQWIRDVFRSRMINT